MIFVLYAALVACVVLFSARLSHYVDLLDRKTTLASAFIGGVMLAAVTSLPELITSITSVAFVGKPSLVIGNVLGSDLFNVFVLGVVFLLYFRGVRQARISTSHNTTALGVIIVYALLLASLWSGTSLFFYGVSGLSIIILALYIWSVRKMSGDEDTAGAQDTSPLTLKQVVMRFAGYSVLLVVASIGITYASDYLAETVGLGTTMAGALLLGIATSLPEMISCFVLARIGNFNAVVGNIMGSNLFNFMIFMIADLVYWNKELYVYDSQAGFLITLGLVANAAVLVLVQLMTRQKRRRAVPVAMLSAVPVLSYVLFVVLSM